MKRTRIVLAILLIGATFAVTGPAVTDDDAACLPVRLDLDVPAVADAAKLHWNLVVVTAGRSPRQVYEQRYPDYVVPLNGPAFGSFVQDLELPPGRYEARLSICDNAADGAERIRVTTNVDMVVVP